MEDIKPLIGLTLEGLRHVVAEQGLPAFTAKQIARRLYVGRVTSLDEITELSKKARAALTEAGYAVGLEKPLSAVKSTDGTKKYLFRGCGGRDVETVMIPDGDRYTLCVSSQAGCKMNCSFCMTGRQGFHGSLTAAQIVNQILSVPEAEKLTNIVFMGMGEPTDNLPAVLDVIEILTSAWGMGWSPKRITVSTVGANTRTFRQLLDLTKVHVAVSLHSPFPAERRGMMPAEGALAASDMMEILRQYDFSHQRRLSFEYIMFKGVNDDARHGRGVTRLLRGLDCRVNLIRFHAIPGSDLQPSSQRIMEEFRDRLNEDGITATIRASRGEDVSAACGMLSGSKREEKESHGN